MVFHLIDFNALSLSDWNTLYLLAQDIKNRPGDYTDSCRGKLLATLFYEPSTRTMLSFQSAMLRIGGNIIGFDNPGTSSVAKGECLKDTIRVIAGYADVAVIRHPLEGAAYAASLYAKCHIINAGDGGHLHPTQTLTDLFTIQKNKGALGGLTVGVCGDLKHGRTVHSLLKALSLFSGNRFILVSTFSLRTPKYILDAVKASGNEYVEVSTLEECISELDVLYMTRIQKERFPSEQAYRKQKGIYVLDKDKLSAARSDLIVLHPLPKVDEIAPEVDFDRRALYFEQAENGMYIRMALILLMLRQKSVPPAQPRPTHEGIGCPNPRCITNGERYLPPQFYRVQGTRKTLACRYCDYRAE